MRLSMPYVAFALSLLYCPSLFAGTQNLNTYYPAPQGNYNNMAVNQTLTVSQIFKLEAGGGCFPVPPLAGNEVQMVNVGGTLQFCDSTGGPYPLSKSNLWATDNTNTVLFPQNWNSINVGIGMNTDPGVALGVKGDVLITPKNDFTVSGNSALGFGGATPSLTMISGKVQINLATGSLMNINNGDVQMAGNVIVGQPASPTSLNVNGDTTLNSTNAFTVNGPGSTFNGTVTANGNTTLGQAGAGNTTTINGNTTITGDTTMVPTNQVQVNGNVQVVMPAGSGNPPVTVPRIVICDANGQNCGYLAVAQAGNGDPNYYAVYAK